MGCLLSILEKHVLMELFLLIKEIHEKSQEWNYQQVMYNFGRFFKWHWAHASLPSLWEDGVYLVEGKNVHGTETAGSQEPGFPPKNARK